MATSFPGFSPKMQTFFRQLEKNNDRAWFQPRKEIFEEHIRQPMIELVTLINEDLKTFALENALAVPAKAIYRIYRDTRFSKDKTPYKTHIGATFPRQGLPKHGGAGYYFGLSHKGVDIAGGMYMPSPEELKAVRAAMLRNPKRFLEVIGDKKLIKNVGQLVGQKLARPPKGYDEHRDSPVAEYLKHKQLYCFATLDAKAAVGPNLRREVVARFKAMSRLMEWMNQALIAARASEEDKDKPRRPDPMW